MNHLRFENLLEALAGPHMVVDRDLCFVLVNKPYEDAVNRTRDELIGKGLFDMFPDEGESGRRLLASLESVIETGESDTLAFLRYEIPTPDGRSMEERFWTATHSPIIGEDGRVEFVVQNTVDVTDIVRMKQASSLPFRNVPSELALLRNAQTVEEAYRETASESAEFRRLFRQAPGMIAVMQGDSHVFTFVNDSYSRFVGCRDLIGLSLVEAIPELRDQGILDLLDDVFRSGRSIVRESSRVVLKRTSDDEALSETFLDFSFNPIRDARGAVTGVFVQAADRTQIVRAMERQRLLIDELNHRVKNTLSTVQSMARQSFRNLHDTDRAREAFEARIMALSQAHNVLSARQWEAAGLSVLLRQELMAFPPDRCTTSGPEVHLTAKSAIALALVFHELASNAVRFGAMSTESGTLEVGWGLERRGGASILVFVWEEQGVPERPGDMRAGFGIRMLHRIIEGELGGKLDVGMSEDGLRCRFEVALSEVEELESSAA